MNIFIENLKTAFQRPNNGLYRILLINIAVFGFIILSDVLLWILGVFPDFSNILLQYIALPSDLQLLLYKPWTIITYMFTHEGFFHILFNMLFLYWFGIIIEEFIGSKKLVAIYILGGIAGAIFYLLGLNLVPAFYNTNAILYGASAGVAAIVVAAATLSPNYTFFLFLLGPVKIKYIAIFFIVVKSFVGLKGLNTGGELAHLGGALLGYLYIIQLRKGTDIGGWLTSLLEWITNLFNAKPKIRVSHRRHTAPKTSAKSTAKGTAEASQEEIDAILDKISDRGYESLTKDEKQKLFNASRGKQG